MNTLLIKYRVISAREGEIIATQLNDGFRRLFVNSLEGYRVADDPFWGIHLYHKRSDCLDDEFYVCLNDGLAYELMVFLEMNKEQALLMLTFENATLQLFATKWLEQ